MAPRRVKMSESPAPEFEEEDLYGASPPPSSRRRHEVNPQSMSHSPASSVSSDKENHSSRNPNSNDKRGRGSMGPPQVPPETERAKRKRGLEAEAANERAHSRRRQTVEVEDQEPDYDPDQDPAERRRIRKGLRDLGKTLLENRTEYLAPNSNGLRDALLKANELTLQIKQTADATIESRLLVTTADLSYKKTIAVLSGNSAQGVDVDDFLAKCKAFMRRGDDEQQPPTNTQRRRRQDAEEDGDEDDNAGDPYNWEYLGRMACLKHNSRPSVPGFLFGPLSVEKKTRKVVVRKAAFKPNNLRETRPEVLKSNDIAKDENANLTTLCTQILTRLKKVAQDAMAACEAAVDDDDEADTDVQALMDAHGVDKDGGMALFKFVINPWSFGQTVENMFYVSFLIRDGKVGISIDKRGLPYLNIVIPKENGEADGHTSKHQAVLALDMATWKDLIEVFDIKKPMILHREEEDHATVGAKGWYA